MDDKELLEVTNEFFAEQGADPKSLKEREKEQPEENPAPAPVDIYQRNQDRIREVNKKSFPKGS